MALENARAASEMSTQATSCDGRGGGSRGRGHGGGRGGVCGRMPTPVHSCEDEDESGNFQF